MQFASDPQRNIERFLKTLLSIDLKSLREFLKNTPSANLVEEKIEKNRHLDPLCADQLREVAALPAGAR